MISAELKSIDFNNIHILTRNDAYLEMLKPVYCLSLVLSIGVLGEDGADYFYVDVFNTGWIEKERFLIGKKSIVVDLDDLDELEKYIRSFISGVHGNNWEDIVAHLKEYFYWEYDNHKFAI